MQRYICIHGHFYQPPRENPWLDAIELQDSASPFHDWNERITAECYGPNARARILNQHRRVWKIVSNYENISYNFGPTLLRWMEQHAPETYQAILQSDRDSAERFGGHGSALAQAYNHMILPLSNDRDRHTQVIWGIADFQHRFGRFPEGMWLPETAVNTSTLETLAHHGIRFTILAPRQAARVRKLPQDGKHATRWKNVGGGKIDPSRAYLCRLPSGRSINLFFYDGPVSQAVAFEKLLDAGETFANRLLQIFDDARDWPQLAHIATDGESYGHHHRHGEMALAYALHYIESNNLAKIINYGQYLELHPPTHEVQIAEDTAWSCNHGVARWMDHCGCNTGGRPKWNQQWRGPLRAALDWLRDALAGPYEQAAAALLKDPWGARNAFISVILNSSHENIERFLEEHASQPLTHEQKVQALKLLDLQHQLMLMYTSCGWFFDEITGIETVQVIQYAGRAVQLAEALFGWNVEEQFLERLERAQSNMPEHGNGRQIYERMVKPAFVDLRKVAAHFAISSLFEEYQERERVFAYDVAHEMLCRATAGQATFAAGRVQVTSARTLEAQRLQYGVVHLGDHIINAGVATEGESGAFEGLCQSCEEAFRRADFPEVLRQIDRHFTERGGGIYTLTSLFADKQREVLKRVLQNTLEEIEADYRRIYEHHAPLIQFLRSIHRPLPRALQLPAEFVLNTDITRALEEEPPNVEMARALLTEAHDRGLTLDHQRLAFVLSRALKRSAMGVCAAPEGMERLSRLHDLADLAGLLPVEVDVSGAQNIFYDLMQTILPAMRQRAEADDEAAATWATIFVSVGEKLAMQVE